MTTRDFNLIDPVLQGDNVELEPEELIEPELEHPDKRKTGRRTNRVREKLSHYGNRVLGSIKHFITVLGETFYNIGVAIGGSVIGLPILIVVRGLKVLLSNFFELFKSLVLSIFRAVFEVLSALMWPIHEAFGNFNKHLLFPLMKRIEHDDSAALIAFAVLLVIVVGVAAALVLIF